jgi:FixJ family two-component response regulator
MNLLLRTGRGLSREDKKQNADPRIDTPLGKIPPGPLAVAQGIARGDSISEIAEALGVTEATVYGYRGYWRPFMKYTHRLDKNLSDEIRDYVERHGLNGIGPVPNEGPGTE